MSSRTERARERATLRDRPAAALVRILIPPSRSTWNAGGRPASSPRERHRPFLPGAVRDREQELQGGLVVREVAPRADRPPKLGVEHLDGVRAVEQPPDIAHGD